MAKKKKKKIPKEWIGREDSKWEDCDRQRRNSESKINKKIKRKN